MSRNGEGAGGGEEGGGEGDREREGGREGGWRRRRGRDVKEKEEDERGNTEIQIITKLIEFSRLPLDGQSRNEQGGGGGANTGLDFRWGAPPFSD